eukprot:scaffold24345_cov64-Attheya_sp.AAC.4
MGSSRFKIGQQRRCSREVSVCFVQQRVDDDGWPAVTSLGAASICSMIGYLLLTKCSRCTVNVRRTYLNYA